MIRLSVPEFGRIPRESLRPRLVRRLQEFDERHARQEGENIFDWSHVKFIRALNYVGVVQIPGLAIEILPKIDLARDAPPDSFGTETETTAKNNLLYMLSITRELPLRDRDLASQQVRKLPLLEFLILLFTTRLLTELRRGVEHAYVYREENLAYVKGRILLNQHIRRNVARSERVFVGYDEFTCDRWLNRILKATCRFLLPITTSAKNGQYLKEALLELADVEDLVIREHHFDRVRLDRSSDRFSPLLDFARLVLLNLTPSPTAGENPTFSLVFPMEQLFEEFIGRFLRKYANDFGLMREHIHLQARSRRRWLMRTVDGVGRFRLKPDVIVDGTQEHPRLILDTKWKRLLSDAEDSKNGVSQTDIYQLYAYANRYACRDNVLLYPRVRGVTPKTYSLDGDALKRTIRIEFVDLSRDLVREKESLKTDLQTALIGSRTVDDE